MSNCLGLCGFLYDDLGDWFIHSIFFMEGCAHVDSRLLRISKSLQHILKSAIRYVPCDVKIQNFNEVTFDITFDIGDVLDYILCFTRCKNCATDQKLRRCVYGHDFVCMATYCMCILFE